MKRIILREKVWNLNSLAVSGLQVLELKPSIFVYCQNPDTNHTALQQLLCYGGEVVRLDNVGRESHAYMQHILRHWNDIAYHTLFSQDIPASLLKPRFLVRSV